VHFNPFLGTFNPGGIFRNFEDTGIIAYRHDIHNYANKAGFPTESTIQLNESELTLPVENCPFKGGVFFGANQENRNDRFTSWENPRYLVGPPEVRYEPVLDLFFSRKLGEFLKEPRQGQTMFLVLDGHCSGQVHCKSRKRNREQKLPVRTGKE